MEDIGECSSFSSNGDERHQESENYKKDKGSHREVRDSIKKLCSWREDSQREFSFIGYSINMGANDLL